MRGAAAHRRVEACGQLCLLEWVAPQAALPPFAKATGLLGDAMLRLRNANGLSQAQVADMSGIQEKRVGYIEAGELPTMDELHGIARALSVDEEDLADLKPGRSDRRRRSNTLTRLALAIPPGDPGSPTWDAVPFERDPVARYFVEKAARNGQGASTEEISAITGWSVRVVQKALKSAMKKMGQMR
jgi:transcriptional regulator with XRE-family HTH domain